MLSADAFPVSLGIFCVVAEARPIDRWRSSAMIHRRRASVAVKSAGARQVSAPVRALEAGKVAIEGVEAL
jgi:hypothetical protein